MVQKLETVSLISRITFVFPLLHRVLAQAISQPLKHSEHSLINHQSCNFLVSEPPPSTSLSSQ